MRLFASKPRSPQDFYYFLSVCETILVTVVDGVGLAGFKSISKAFFIGIECSHHFLPCTIFPFLEFISGGWYCGAVVFGLTG